MFEILLPLVFYIVYYCLKGFVKPFAGLIFIFLGSIRKIKPAGIGLNCTEGSDIPSQWMNGLIITQDYKKVFQNLLFRILFLTSNLSDNHYNF